MKILTPFLLLCGICSVSVFAGTQDEGLLVFTISSPKSVYAVYEPIPMTFTLVNNNSYELKGDFGLGGWRGRDKLGFTYRRNGGKIWDYRIQSTVLCVRPEIRPLPAHGNRSTVETYLYDRAWDREQFIFSEPGVYEFQARYSYADFTEKIYSNTLKITVVDVPADESGEVLALWKDPHLAQMIQGNMIDEEEHQKGALKKLQTLLTEYPNSFYTKAAMESIRRMTDERKRFNESVTGFRQTALEMVQQAERAQKQKDRRR